MQKQEKKSPLKDRPLRYAGQSLDEQFDKLINEKLFTYILAVGLFAIMAIQEWIRYIFKSPPQPWIYTILAIAVAVFCTLKIKKLLPLARSINQGRLLALRYLSALLPESNAGGKVRSPFQQVGNSAYGLD